MTLRSVIGLTAFISFIILPAYGRSQEQQGPSGIVVHLDALATNDGTVYCDLYDDEEGFPGDPKQAVARQKVRPNGRQAKCLFPNVKSGRYAVAVWHDIDGDQKFDKNWLGIPTEPVGASNNAKGKFGPPKFKDAAFSYEPPLVNQTIQLQ